EDPYGSWIVKVKLSDPSELEELLSREEAKEWVEKNL
ncbi:MAG: glycine cleavage system protein H, partial [Candidatus Aenigmatarchaeota archaeon]